MTEPKKRAKVICLAQYKGGTAKTSSVINIAAQLVNHGYKVLVVDLDMQASLTLWLGIDPVKLGRDGTVRALLTDQREARDVIIQTNEGIDLIPSNLDLALVEFHMPAIRRESILARKLEPILEDYDYIVFDTTPNFNITTLNAMVAANYLLIPFQPEPLCLYGLDQLTETFDMVRYSVGSEVNVLGLFITLYDSRVTVHKKIVAKIREDWGDLVFKTAIRRRSSVLEDTLEGKSAIMAAPNTDIAHDYQKLTEEIISRAQENH